MRIRPEAGCEPAASAASLTPPAPLPYTERVVGKCAAFFVFLLMLVIPDASLAEHEVYYRYTVLGYVKDAAGGQRPGVAVELVREKTGFSYLAETDHTGLYVIVARLGDESMGESLRVRVAGQSVIITARFDPADHIHERGTRVDFSRGQPVETPPAFAATLRRFLGQ